MNRPPPFPRRRAFTLVELLVALSIITVALGVIASLAFFGFEDRAQQQARFRALEAAANLLESARAMPWEQLHAEWAQHQKMTGDAWLPEGQIHVKVESETGQPQLKRVTVRVEWLAPSNRPRLHVELIGFFAARAHHAEGGKS